MAGLSLACYGGLHAVSQAFVTGPMVERLGSGALLAGIVADALGFIGMGVATVGWMPFALCSLRHRRADLADAVAPGRRAAPRRAARHAGQPYQPRQGPLVVTAGFAATQSSWPGCAWIVAALVYSLTPPLLFSRRARGAQKSGPLRRPALTLPRLALALQPPLLRAISRFGGPPHLRHMGGGLHEFDQPRHGVGAVALQAAGVLGFDDDDAVGADTLVGPVEQALLDGLGQRRRRADVEAQVDGVADLVDVLPTGARWRGWRSSRARQAGVPSQLHATRTGTRAVTAHISS